MTNHNFDFTSSVYWDKRVTKEQYNELVNALFNKHNGDYESIVREINAMPYTPIRHMLYVFSPIFPAGSNDTKSR